MLLPASAKALEKSRFMESPEKAPESAESSNWKAFCQLVLIDSNKGIHIKTAVLIHGAEFLIRKDIDGGVRHLLFHNLGFLCFLHNVAGQRCRVIDAGGQGRGGRVRGRLDNTGDCELFRRWQRAFFI